MNTQKHNRASAKPLLLPSDHKSAASQRWSHPSAAHPVVALAPGWMPTSRSSKRRFRRSRRHRPSSRSPTLLPLSSACLSLPSISWIVAGLYQVHASRPHRSIAPRGPNGTAESSRGSTPFAANSPPCRRHNPTGNNSSSNSSDSSSDSSSSTSTSDSEPTLHELGARQG